MVNIETLKFLASVMVGCMDFTVWIKKRPYIAKGTLSLPFSIIDLANK